MPLGASRMNAGQKEKQCACARYPCERVNDQDENKPPLNGEKCDKFERDNRRFINCTPGRSLGLQPAYPPATKLRNISGAGGTSSLIDLDL